jgi:phage/plasmid-like protein (TIGR03299 family)
MPAMLENMMYAGSVPWHGLGTKVNADISVRDAIRVSGLDWEVSLEPLYLRDGREAPRRAVVRSTDRSILGTVGLGYVPLQNRDAFTWFEPFLRAGVGLDTAGSLYGGARVWVLATLSGGPMEIAPGDAVAKYLLLSNSHDGSSAVRVGFTPVRVVCANTLAMAHSDTESKLIRIRHTANVVEDLNAVREIIDAVDMEFRATAEQYRALLRRGVSTADLAAYVRVVFRSSEGKTPKAFERLVELFETGRGNDLPAVRGTYWAAYNAVTEFLSHERGRTADNRLDSLWFGEAGNLNRRAFEAALLLASGASFDTAL